jgi:hypothetical protein
MLQHSLILESARAPSYDALAYLCTQTLNVISRESTVGESTVASALQQSLSSLDSSKFSNVLSRWVSEYASWLKIGILNSILKLTEASKKASPDLDPLKLQTKVRKVSFIARWQRDHCGRLSERIYWLEGNRI